MKSVLAKSVLLAVSISLVGCSTNTQNQNTGIGAVTGAVVGGLAGSLVGGGTGKAVAIGVGIVAGALVGGYIGHSMDSSDRANVYNSVSSGRSSTWENQKTHTKYRVVPSKHYVKVKGNPNCRTFTTTAMVNGKTQNVKGVACRQADGSWKIAQ